MRSFRPAPLLFALILSLSALPVFPAPHPNLLLIFAADLGWSDVGFTGNRYYETPRIDRIADESLRFTDAYVAAPNCAPAGHAHVRPIPLRAPAATRSAIRKRRQLRRRSHKGHAAEKQTADSARKNLRGQTAGRRRVCHGDLRQMAPRRQRGPPPADAPFGKWNRFHLIVRGDRLTVMLNGKKVIDDVPLPGLPASGPIGLQYHHDAVEFTNLFISEL